MPRDLFLELENETKRQPRDLFAEIKPKTKFGKFVTGATDYLYPQWLTEAKFQPGQQNIYGDIFNRPAAAIRSGLMGQGYAKGAVMPEEVSKFQDVLLKKYYENMGERKPTLAGKIGGFGVSAAGLGADILTNPADILLTYLGIKGGKAIGREMGKAGELIGEKGTQVLQSPFGRMVGRGLTRTGETIKTIPSRFPQVMGRDYTLARAQKATNLLDDTRGFLGKMKGEAIKQAGDKIIDAQKLSSELPTLPKNVLNALDDPIYAIEKLPDGSIKPTISNLDKVKEALGDFMTSKTWEEATTKNKQLIKQAYGTVGKAMREAAPEIAEPIEKYHNFMGIYRDVNKTLRTTEGTILEKKLRGAFRPGAERQYQVAWEKMQKYIPDLKQIAKDITKFNQRQVTKRFLKRGALYLGGFEAGRRFIVNPLLRGISGEERRY